MKKLFILIFCIFSLKIIGQKEPTSTTFFKPYPENFTVKHAIEVETIVSTFFKEGFSVGLGYRYKRIRLRVGVSNAGNYDVERAGITNSKLNFKRNYTTTPGVHLGFNVWRNLEVYTFLEFQNFKIIQKSTSNTKSFKSLDSGLGIGYQIFIGRYFYIQPGLQMNLRMKNNLEFIGVTYQLPRQDVFFVFRVGIRLWKKF